MRVRGPMASGEAECIHFALAVCQWHTHHLPVVQFHQGRVQVVTRILDDHFVAWLDQGGDGRKQHAGGAGTNGDFGVRIVARPFVVGLGNPPSQGGLPAMGAYWLCPASMALVTAARSASGVSKSGNPCATLSAPQADANADISVKMVVPTWGILDRGSLGVWVFIAGWQTSQRRLLSRRGRWRTRGKSQTEQGFHLRASRPRWLGRLRFRARQVGDRLRS